MYGLTNSVEITNDESSSSQFADLVDRIKRSLLPEPNNHQGLQHPQPCPNDGCVRMLFNLASAGRGFWATMDLDRRDTGSTTIWGVAFRRSDGEFCGIILGQQGNRLGGWRFDTEETIQINIKCVTVSQFCQYHTEIAAPNLNHPMS